MPDKPILTAVIWWSNFMAKQNTVTNCVAGYKQLQSCSSLS